ncbi:hypothetical protein PUN28_004948 [Cardiocondyla obscurior]|uniref:Uncharacterized protein n=1 Tax=Cardiocondyla obscurior TaxID=286306 RepID=A0AAW2GF25_9HYME
MPYPEREGFATESGRIRGRGAKRRDFRSRGTKVGFGGVSEREGEPAAERGPEEALGRDIGRRGDIAVAGGGGGDRGDGSGSGAIWWWG